MEKNDNKAKTLFFIASAEDSDNMSPCDNCEGTGHKTGKVFDDYYNEEIVMSYSCPKCNGTGFVRNDIIKKLSVKEFVKYGESILFDGTDNVKFFLGFWGTQEQVDVLMKQFHVSNATQRLDLLEWIELSDKMQYFDTKEEAELACAEKEKELAKKEIQDLLDAETKELKDKGILKEFKVENN